ncbi:MAG: hypothetical protein QM820_15825 [Minicystis sp.]
MPKRASWLLSVAALAAGCQLLVDIDPDEIHHASGGSGGATTTATTGGAPGTGGAAAACLLPIECPGIDTECRVRTCVAGACGIEDTAEGTPTASQVKGDCKKRVCDGAGSTKLVNDDSDVLDDGNGCTSNVCVSGVPRHPMIDAGTSCGEGKVCDGMGSCVGCTAAAQCGGQACVNNTCVPASCVDLKKDFDETGIDCGGPACTPCVSGGACLVASDCASGVCGGAPKTCLVATCADGVKNGGETDTDCGGGCAARCAPGAGCHVDGDCAGGACSGSVCLPSCNDGVRNGNETGLDCGGACPPCALGDGCLFDVDCAEGLCRGGLCVPATCADGKHGALETDVDCGGLCAPCSPGKACAAGSDCASGVCAGTLCAKPGCNDHVRNAAETGVDCGGPTCGKCPDGQGCAAATDCASGICLGGACVPVGCADGVKDLNETDIDCGGSTCPGCAGGRACVDGSDCASTVCMNGTCTTPTCKDVLQNGGETDVDCGGPCPVCALGQGCMGPADCDTVACSGGKCVLPTCSDAVKNAAETGVDCGGPTCSKCPGGQGCVVAADCASGMCTAGLCEPSCTDGLRDGNETDVDCGGGVCAGCPAGKPCAVDGDCASGVCSEAMLCAAPTCSDGVKNGDESDVDCGGPTCGKCPNGKACGGDADCASTGCSGAVCVEKLLLSEIRTRGAGGRDDEFIELYNPGSLAIVVDSSWKIGHQSALGGCNAPTTAFAGGGQVVPPHRYLLIGGPSYEGTVTPDATLLGTPGMSLDDTGSIWLTHGGATVDAICFSYDLTSSSNISAGCNINYICEGMQASNLPHNDNNAGNVDASMERKQDQALGKVQDTGDSSADFQVSTPSHPQNLASPAFP